MSKITLIVITGLPATGKTTLGKKLAADLCLPYICKDDYKEIIFDNLGWSDREWSNKVSSASYDLLYHFTEEILKSGNSLILETNFNPKFANQNILNLKAKYDFTLFQIRCHTQGQVLFDRFVKRCESPERHRGHVESGNREDFRYVIENGKIEALDIGGELYDIDTTDFEKVDYGKIIEAIKVSTGIN